MQIFSPTAYIKQKSLVAIYMYKLHDIHISITMASVLIRHIAITNCPFRFAFSHLPRYGQLLQQKHRMKQLDMKFVCKFSQMFRFQQAKPIRIINLGIGLAFWNR